MSRQPVVTCAQLSPVWIIHYDVKATCIFTQFELWAHNTSVKRTLMSCMIAISCHRYQMYSPSTRLWSACQYHLLIYTWMNWLQSIVWQICALGWCSIKKELGNTFQNCANLSILHIYSPAIFQKSICQVMFGMLFKQHLKFYIHEYVFLPKHMSSLSCRYTLAMVLVSGMLTCNIFIHFHNLLKNFLCN